MSVTFSIFIFFQNVRFCMFSLYYLVFCFCAFRATELLNAGFFGIVYVIFSISILFFVCISLMVSFCNNRTCNCLKSSVLRFS